MTLQHGNEVFVPDLVRPVVDLGGKSSLLNIIQGGDKIWRLVRNGAPGNWKIQGSIAQPQGSGPRHLAIHGRNFFPFNCS